jgi:probable F420-dependent oxidoreductase
MTGIGQVRLAPFGLWTAHFENAHASEIRATVSALEQDGWTSLWFPESRGREALSLAGYLLATTTTMTIANGIANISARRAKWTYGGAELLADAYPGRHVLGLGVGPARPGLNPIVEMNDYLDELDSLATNRPSPPPHRLLAAYGPQMLALARDRAGGAHTYHVNTVHTRQAREILGHSAFLGVEQPVLFQTDPSAARETAREHLSHFLVQRYNLAKFRRLGYGEEDFVDGGSDRLVDDLVYWGDLDTITERLHDHLRAGADHVAVQVIGLEPGRSPGPYWHALRRALIAA